MEWQALLLGGVAALLVGMAKNGVPGLGILVVPLMALAFPTRTSVGTLLPMLITGDIIAILYYRRHAQWSKLWGLFPYVACGMALAWFVLKRIDDDHLRPLLGLLVLLLLLLELMRDRLGWTHLPHHPLFAAGTGASAGFATTVGNAAGPIMSLYLISRGLPKQQFVGTAAWFFFIVNVSKVPLYGGLGMITRESLLFDLAMAPLVVAGALLGIRLLPVISQKVFNRLVLILSAVAAISLLV